MAYHGGAWLAMASHGWPWRALPGHGGPCLAIAGHGQARKHERQQRKHVLFVVISTKTGAVCCQMLIACCLLLVVCFLRFASCESSFFFLQKGSTVLEPPEVVSAKRWNFFGGRRLSSARIGRTKFIFCGFWPVLFGCGWFCSGLFGLADVGQSWLVINERNALLIDERQNLRLFGVSRFCNAMVVATHEQIKVHSIKERCAPNAAGHCAHHIRLQTV